MPSSVNTCCLRIIPILTELDITICDFQFSFLVYWFGGQVVGGNKKEKSASIEIQLLADFRGVRDEIRTHTAQRPLPPQSSVSTNFTTWALLSRINFRECKYRHYFAIRKIFAEKTTKFAWGPPGSFCGGPGMLYLSVISLSR